MMITPPDRTHYDLIYDIVAQVPSGKVATYGNIAYIVGRGVDARNVGYALNAIPKDTTQAVPWQRIINSQGGISTVGVGQQQLLEAEGVVFDERGRVDLAVYRWDGPSAAWAEARDVNTLPSYEAKPKRASKAAAPEETAKKPLTDGNGQMSLF